MLTAAPRLGPTAGLPSGLPSEALAPVGCDFWPSIALSPSGANLHTPAQLLTMGLASRQQRTQLWRPTPSRTSVSSAERSNAGGVESYDQKCSAYKQWEVMCSAPLLWDLRLLAAGVCRTQPEKSALCWPHGGCKKGQAWALAR